MCRKYYLIPSLQFILVRIMRKFNQLIKQTWTMKVHLKRAMILLSGYVQHRTSSVYHM